MVSAQTVTKPDHTIRQKRLTSSHRVLFFLFTYSEQQKANPGMVAYFPREGSRLVPSQRGNPPHQTTETSPPNSPGNTERSANSSARMSSSLRTRDASDSTVATTSSRKKAKKTEIDVLIREAIRKEVWRLVKFIPGEDDLPTISKTVLGVMGLNEYDVRSEDPEEVTKCDEWAATYGKNVSQTLNEIRQDVVGRIRNECYSYLDVHDGEDLPTFDVMRSCLARVSTCSRDAFCWYWDKLLPATTGNAVHWTPEIRHCTTISKGQVGDNPKAKLIPDTTEAFCLLVYESNRDKWQKVWQVQQTVPGKQVKIRKNEAAIKKKCDKFHCMCWEEDATLLSKWTDSNCGQAKFGGWKDEGLDRFIEFRKDVKKGRAKSHNETLENEILTLLRAQNNITAPTPEEQRKLDGYGQRKTPAAAKPGKKGLLWNPDDEFVSL